MVPHICNPSTQEAEAGESCELHSKTLSQNTNKRAMRKQRYPATWNAVEEDQVGLSHFAGKALCKPVTRLLKKLNIHFPYDPPSPL
jgi:hypothetical protein